jgi:DNA-binding response OmpR family regulator
MENKSATIMIVDDDTAISSLISHQLRSLGYRTVCLHDGLQALQHLAVVQPDLVLLDVMMPHMSGWDVCRQIRTCSGTPIILLTAKDADADLMTGLNAGADDYIAKPYRIAQLHARVEAALRATFTIAFCRVHRCGSRRHGLACTSGNTSADIFECGNGICAAATSPAWRNPARGAPPTRGIALPGGTGLSRAMGLSPGD